ncbi:MAG: hypothetical protein Aurels2KO_10180 [Aureliella sp.]
MDFGGIKLPEVVVTEHPKCSVVVRSRVRSPLAYWSHMALQEARQIPTWQEMRVIWIGAVVSVLGRGWFCLQGSRALGR